MVITRMYISSGSSKHGTAVATYVMLRVGKGLKKEQRVELLLIPTGLLSLQA